MNDNLHFHIQFHNCFILPQYIFEYKSKAEIPEFNNKK